MLSTLHLLNEDAVTRNRKAMVLTAQYLGNGRSEGFEVRP
jgi:hypothetical protein